MKRTVVCREKYIRLIHAAQLYNKKNSIVERYFIKSLTLHVKSLQITGLTGFNLYTVTTRVRSHYSGSNRLGILEGDVQ